MAEDIKTAETSQEAHKSLSESLEDIDKVVAYGTPADALREASDAIVRVFDAGTEARLIGKERPRCYIGASSIGNTCDAYQVLNLRGFPNNPETPRQARIFELGKIMEDEIVKTLKAGGLDVVAKQDNGKQFAFSAFGGHYLCHLDGIVKTKQDSLLLEVKTMNAKRYKKFVKYGVRASDPHYYHQMQCCMQLSFLRNALFVSYCKDTSEFHAEIVPYDPADGEALKATAKRILEAEELERNESWECSYCFKRNACLEGALNPVSGCAQCKFSRPVITEHPYSPKRMWRCIKKDIFVGANKRVCEEFIPFNHALF